MLKIQHPIQIFNVGGAGLFPVIIRGQGQVASVKGRLLPRNLLDGMATAESGLSVLAWCFIFPIVPRQHVTDALESINSVDAPL